MINFDFKYRFNLFKNNLKDRVEGIDRKKLFSGLVTVLMVALIPGTLSLVNRINNLNKQAASCTTRSNIILTNQNGNGIQNANSGDIVRTNIYVTGVLDAAEIAVAYDKSKFSLVDEGIGSVNSGSFTHIRGATADANAGVVIFSIARPLDGSSSIDGKIASIDFRVLSSEANSRATFSYGSKTSMVKGGIASGSNCGRSNSDLILNPSAGSATPTQSSGGATPTQQSGGATPTQTAATPTATSHPLAPCVNYERNCVRKELTCPANSNLDPNGQCGQDFKCCIPTAGGSNPTPTPTQTTGGSTPTQTAAIPTVTSHPPAPCLNYERNCAQRTPADYPNIQGCPANTTYDPNGQCGQEFKCCLPQ